MAGGHIAVLGALHGDGIGGDTTTAATGGAGVSPMGVHSGILVKHGGRGDLSTAVLFGVPAVEAVAAAAGGSGQRRGQLLVGGFHGADRGRTAVAVKFNGVLSGRRGALGGIEGKRDNSLFSILCDNGSRLAVDLEGGSISKAVIADDLQRNLHGILGAACEGAADGGGFPIGRSDAVGAASHCHCIFRSCALDGCGDGHVDRRNGSQRGERAGIHRLAAVNALGVPCALCADTSVGTGNLAALHMGGFNLALADKTLLVVLGGISRVGRPCAEGVVFELSGFIATGNGAGLIVAVVVQLCPRTIVMRMGAILNDVVDRVGVGKDGLFNGSAGAGITQRALRHFYADGRGGGLRGRAADGDDQGLCIVGFLLYGRFQTSGQIGKPAGNNRAYRKIFRKYVAIQRNAYVDRGDFFIYLADYACVGNSGIGNAGVGIFLLIAMHPICRAIVTLHADTGECVESVHTITTAKSDALLLRFIFLPLAGIAEIIHIQIIIRPHDLCIDNISGQGDVQAIIEAGAGSRVGNRRRACNLSEVTGYDVAKFLHVAVTLRVIKASLDGGVLANRYLCTIIFFYGVCILCPGRSTLVIRVRTVCGIENPPIGIRRFQFYIKRLNELAACGIYRYIRCARDVIPFQSKLIACKVLTIGGNDNPAGHLWFIRLWTQSCRDKSIRTFSVAAVKRCIIFIHQLPACDGLAECKVNLAVINRRKPAVGRLLGELNLLESGIHFHIAVRHGKGRFLLGRICEGHAGGFRIPPGEHHVAPVIRCYGNGFSCECRGGICRASAVRDRDAVRHGSGGFFLRRQLPKANQCLTDLCLRATTEIGPEGKAEGIYAFIKLEVLQRHRDSNLVTRASTLHFPRVASHSLAVLEDIQPVAEVNLTGVHLLQLLVAAGGDIDILCQGAVAAKRHITGNGGGALGGKRRAIRANLQRHVLQRVLGQRCDRDGLIVAVYQTSKV